MIEEAKPCPFCGHVGIAIHEGSTFRWRVAECDACGARCGEVRVQTIGEGTKEEWEAEATSAVTAEWNRRSWRLP